MRAFVSSNRLEMCPMARRLRGYTVRGFGSDARAGFNVALLGFPQGMAYAAVADLPLHYGITCATVASLIGPFFAASRHTVLGPTNATAFIIFSVAGSRAVGERLELMPLLVLMVGLFLVIGACLRLADLIQYVSRSVIVGYLAGAALLIIGSQLQHVFGIDAAIRAGRESGEPGARTLVGIVGELAAHLPAFSWPAVAAAGLAATLYFLMRLWMRGLAFPLALVGSSAAVAVLHRWAGFEVAFSPGFEAKTLIPALPDFRGHAVFRQIYNVLDVALAVAFLAALENSVMSRTLASHTGDRPDQNQDMFSVGMANLGTAFLSGMPASGSLTRSALNFASGAQTQISSLVGGILCLVGALTLGPLVAWVPKACLASLVICIAATLVSRKNLRICLTATRSDAAVVVVTFLAALLAPLHVAIVLGAGVSITLYLKKASRPQLAEYEFDQQGQLLERDKRLERQNPAISIIHVEGDLFFGATELFRNQIQQVSQDPNLKVIILRMRNARHLDATSVMALEDLIRYLRAHGRALLISGAGPEIRRVLQNSGLLRVLDDDPPEWRTEKRDRNLFLNDPRNPNLSTRDALKRAQEILGTREAEIRIFYDAAKPRGA